MFLKFPMYFFIYFPNRVLGKVKQKIRSFSVSHIFLSTFPLIFFQLHEMSDLVRDGQFNREVSPGLGRKGREEQEQEAKAASVSIRERRAR